MKVKSIDVYGIEDRLRKSKFPEDKEVWNYIKKLKEAYERQGDLIKKAMSKIRQDEKATPSLPDFIAKAREIGDVVVYGNISLNESDLRELYNYLTGKN